MYSLLRGQDHGTDGIQSSGGSGGVLRFTNDTIEHGRGRDVVEEVEGLCMLRTIRAVDTFCDALKVKKVHSSSNPCNIFSYAATSGGGKHHWQYGWCCITLNMSNNCS